MCHLCFDNTTFVIRYSTMVYGTKKLWWANNVHVGYWDVCINHYSSYEFAKETVVLTKELRDGFETFDQSSNSMG